MAVLYLHPRKWCFHEVVKCVSISLVQNNKLYYYDYVSDTVKRAYDENAQRDRLLKVQA